MDRLSAAKLQSGETNKKPLEGRAPDIDVRGQQIQDPDVSPEGGVFTRRNVVLGGAALAAAGAAEATGLNPFTNFLGKPLGELDYHTKANEFKRILEQRYGIRLSMGPQQGQDRVLGDPMLLEKYRTVMEVIADELSKYPPEMLQKIGKDRVFEIRVIDNLYLKAPEDAVLPGVTKITGGNAQWHAKDGATRISLKANETERQLRRNIHHELNHIFSFEWQDQNARDRRWVRLNSETSRNPYVEVPEDVEPDTPTDDRRFLSLNASSKAEEDQAVCAEWMMTPLLHAEFLTRWRDEQDQDVKNALAAKYIETKNNYLNWSGGKIDDAFWQVIIKRGEEELTNRKKPQVSS
ncbi:hypothetical protein A3C20_03555 [Candidatus Kaiserbacteria bacterium RIFCSPHIGHO2_02_FULL_55_25]|uniref:Uncharacterized protein n=1 Tax=Candidatus Kaiserbacteria bacterium RIFCSPHIGHO2_02_FULL_55_25 TaxID=1798498 RepID=A0A1F6E5S0_9BACT|nr:MAG: hypothetical protein A3C20_03555 [Candidatus Kaiserbacteria bacterium RIFCSPHIGHO2_02_FULL_55_25]OGG78568.1 MAG: hypothetical protein A3F56_00180 [Candidatus Kaiserbacteria bacterium RIFCSPHIGHO2_12_FULL_55_13]